MKKAHFIPFTILFFFTVFLVSACGNSGESSKNNRSIVKITFENGETFKISTYDLEGGFEKSNAYRAHFTSGTKVIIFNTNNIGPIEEGDKSELNITIKDVKNVAPLDEEFRSFYYTGKDNGKEGNATITFSSINGDKVSAPFSGTLYSPSGSSAQIEGELNSVRKK